MGILLGITVKLNRQLLKKILRTNVKEIRETVNNLPKDKHYIITLKEIRIGYILESYHASVSYDSSEYAYVNTEYCFSFAVSDSNIDKHKYYNNRVLDYKSALDTILSQIPDECHKHVQIKIIEDEGN